ncbi:hypothetical protein HYS49_02030 [Candidatus Woesearchaeota archaeon]|nr:hypothetical protein [Candidatus Woesearchaeota archaeon]
MNIGVDLDEVLADSLPALLQYHNSTYGTSLTKDLFTSYHFWETWGGTREEAIRKVYDFHKTLFFRSIKPVEGSQEAISSLQKNNKLFVITSRQRDIAEATEKWILHHFLDAFSGVHFTNEYSLTGVPTTKAKICEELGVSLMIEDSLDYAIDCVTSQRIVLLFDRLWNKSSELPDGIYRVHSWKQIMAILSG